MKVLLLTNMHRNFHAGYYYLIQELAKHEKVTCYSNFDTRRKLFPIDVSSSYFNRVNMKFGKGWHKLSKRLSRNKRVRDIKRISSDFDVAIVIQNEFFAQVGYDQDASFIQCPKINLVADVHLGYGEYLTCIKKSGFDLTLFVYKWWMDKIKDKIDSRVGWLPHSVNTEVFKDYGLPKTYDVVSAGMRWIATYPLRSKIVEAFSSDPAIRFKMPVHPQLVMKRPRFCQNFDHHILRENYARFLNQGKLFIFCSSIHNYPLAKYFEGMASGTLVLAPNPKDASDLHFKAGENFVEINESNFIAATKYFLAHPGERNEIAKHARSLVEKHHSSVIRAEQLRRFIHEL